MRPPELPIWLPMLIPMPQTDEPSAAKPQPKELNELHRLNRLHEVEEFARAAEILTDSSTEAPAPVVRSRSSRGPGFG